MVERTSGWLATVHTGTRDQRRGEKRPETPLRERRGHRTEVRASRYYVFHSFRLLYMHV